MTSEELHKKLSDYIGLRVRITSDATSSGNLWRDSYPELTEVLIRDSDNVVCCKTGDGVWSIVQPEGLVIEEEPAVGTYDFARPAMQMEMIGAAFNTYKNAVSKEPPVEERRQLKRMDWSDW
jgi:hypothetical protein